MTNFRIPPLRVRAQRPPRCLTFRDAVIACASSSPYGSMKFRPEIPIDGTTTRVLVEQTGSIDVSRLGDHHGLLTPEEQWAVDLALEMVLDLQ
jgi:mRNA interferase MazF